MNLEKLKEEVKNDLTIDKTELGSESVRIPQIHNKYLNFLMNDRLVLSKLETDLTKLRHRKWLYYTGKMSHEELEELGWEPFDLTVLKTDIDRFINADDEVITLQHKVSLLREKVNYLDGVMKAINNLNWNIRAAIDWMKMTEFSG